MSGPPTLPRAVLTLSEFSVVGPAGVPVDQVSAVLPAFGLTVLLGPAGAGKSALLRALSGHLGDDGLLCSGQATFNGLPLGASSRPVRVCATDAPVRPSLRAFLMDARQVPTPHAGFRQAPWLATWLARLGQHRLVPALDAPVCSLAPADQRMVMLLRCHLLGVPLLLVDDLMADLTEAEAAPLLRLLRQLARRMAVLLATRHRGHALALASHVLCLEQGRLVQDMPATRFFARHRQTQRPLRALEPMAARPAWGPEGLNWQWPQRLGALCLPHPVRGLAFAALQRQLAELGVTRLVPLWPGPVPPASHAVVVSPLTAHGLGSDTLIGGAALPPDAELASIFTRLDQWLVAGDCVVLVSASALPGRRGEPVHSGRLLSAYQHWCLRRQAQPLGLAS